jgi:signal transduction histidine kinase
MNSTSLLSSVDTLVACKDLSELTGNVAELAQQWLETRDVLVLLRSGDAEFSAGEPNARLRPWAEGLLRVGTAPLTSGADGRLAALLQANGFEIRGVVALELAEPESTDEVERTALLKGLADLTATCCAQIQRRALADRALQDTRALVVRGLHDLCTPLNVLRLGMHLLEPALTAKDPAVAQRAHRAVDRMAALVGTMADAIGGADNHNNLSA